jgi:hypothetical protein
MPGILRTLEPKWGFDHAAPMAANHGDAYYVMNANWAQDCTAEMGHDLFGGDYMSIFKSTWKDW